MKIGNIVKHECGQPGTGEIIAIEKGRYRVQWDAHTSWHDADELMVQLSTEESFEQLSAMFEEYLLDEYKPAFEAIKADYERVCRELRLHKGGNPSGKGTAA